MGIERIADGHYRIDAVELARKACAPGAGSVEDVVADHVAKWYRPRSTSGEITTPSEGVPQWCGWDDEGDMALIARALEAASGSS